MKKILNKENVIDFLVMGLAAAVGVVILAPYVAKLWARVPFPK